MWQRVAPASELVCHAQTTRGPIGALDDCSSVQRCLGDSVWTNGVGG